MMCLAACSRGKEEASQYVNSVSAVEDQKQITKNFELTSQENTFLVQLCKELIDFDAETTMDKKFWRDFLFYSYTGDSLEGAETAQVYREDLGFDERAMKVSL